MGLLRELLGLGAEPGRLTILQVSLRGVIVFAAALLVIWIGGRSFKRKGLLNIVVLAALGWILSCALSGSGSFFVFIGAAVALTLVYRAVISLRARFSSKALSVMKPRL